MSENPADVPAEAPYDPDQDPDSDPGMLEDRKPEDAGVNDRGPAEGPDEVTGEPTS